MSSAGTVPVSSSGPTVRALIAPGLDAAMQRIVCPAAGNEIRLWNTGQSWKLFDLGERAAERYGAPYWMVHRGARPCVDAQPAAASAPPSAPTGSDPDATP